MVKRNRCPPTGDGAPTYHNTELQNVTLDGRLKVAIGIRDRAAASGDMTRFVSTILGCEVKP